ncbi:heterokaryon incompatibility protein-domain-containing protein [Stachybotrys elegans]|uniref:Heterokaryon incompatibility protein-domain-containing protein n=1 Tax=Stachybotrys elegans TaxID=80388 RepID=A0A8K0SAS0_9HYPO|nr:heterokaryon incompatibility protein-domain-containing protein [Stachybotrys elegans]
MRNAFRRHIHLGQSGSDTRPEEIRCVIQLDVGEQKGAEITNAAHRALRTIPRRACRKMEPAELPTRYLDIGCRDNDRIKVVTSQVGEKGTYACLSHCWGGKSICTLTSDTGPRFSKAVPPRLLPTVFKDAITICRKLGFQRIWIDSLCIQQDNREDWMCEAPKMGQYYSNCTICIAATSSADSNGSLEPEPRPSAVRSQEIANSSLVSHPTHLLQYKPHFSHTRDPRSLLDPFPLFTRAWVLQERLLAPRTLHFCRTEVAFECSESRTCECGAFSKNVWDIGERPPNTFIRYTFSSNDGLICRRKPLVILPWPELVSTYSLLDLTHKTDRLLAISGIAPIMATIHGWKGEYFAGLWQHRLASDLMCRPVERRQRPTQYIAPSWSWASVLDQVQYLREDREYLFDVLDARVNLVSKHEPFGAVKEGCYLRLRGKTVASSWTKRPGRNSDPHSNSDQFILADVVGTQLLDNDDTKGLQDKGPLFERIGMVEYGNRRNGVYNKDPNEFEEKEIFLI